MEMLFVGSASDEAMVRLTETGEYLLQVVLCYPSVLVVVDELEGFFKLLNLSGFEEREHAGWLSPRT